MTDEAQVRPNRNYWKIAFWVVLLAFEFTREVAVVASDTPARANVSFNIMQFGDFATASGQWQRIDRGEKLLDSAVKIECRKSVGECIEVSVNGIGDDYFEPYIDRFTAKFDDSGVSYENNSPNCVQYSVRLDFKLKSVLATRQKKTGNIEARCANLEPTIKMQLGDSNDSRPFERPDKKHFIPLISLIMWFFTKPD